VFEPQGKRSVPDYDSVPYPGTPIPGTAPLSLALCSLYHGGPAPPIRGYRVGELGCGDGANLVPLAFYAPDSTFIGFDSSYRQIRSARAAGERVGATNIEFIVGDIRDLAVVDSVQPGFDYIIVHGVYSWVSQDVRTAILTFCRRTLSPSGLAFISYNAQPGWAVRRLVREVLLRTAEVQAAPVTEQAARAIETAGNLLNYLQGTECASATVLAEELQRVRQAKPFYVLHEYLAEFNNGFWLRDFVDEAARRGLRYVGDAQFCRPQGQVPATLRASLAGSGLNPIDEQETADIVGHRYFRESVLCRDDATPSASSKPSLIEKVVIASSLAARSDPFALHEGTVEVFIGAHGVEVTVDTSITKAALIGLARQWPGGERLQDLLHSASSLLLQNGFAVAADARTTLVAELTTLFEAGQIEWRLTDPAEAFALPEQPRLHPLARHQTSVGHPVTTAFHTPIELEPESRALIAALDGAHTRSELATMFGQELVDRVLPLVARWGLLDGADL
jgi:SAM-dependent methyltransferase